MLPVTQRSDSQANPYLNSRSLPLFGRSCSTSASALTSLTAASQML